MRSLRNGIRKWGVALLGLSAGFAGLPQAQGHLSIIRQGPESAAARESFDQYGTSLAAGDFNGDGFVDLAVGVPLENIEDASGTLLDAGAVIISYGSWTGLVPQGAQSMTQGALGYTNEVDDRFGASLAVGNFNNDAYDDLAIGSPDESIDGEDDAGNVIIVYGSASGLQFTGADLFSQANSPGVVEAGDAFGSSLATGDFNNDGFDDLAVGVPGEDLETGGPVLVDAGAVEFYFGSAGGLTSAGAYILTDDDTINAAQAGARFGFALASGDFDNDNRDDLAVGLPGKSVSGFPEHGVIEVLYGTASGISATGAQLLSEVSLGGVNEVGDQFGSSLAAGDANGDGYDDVAVGAPYKDNGIATDGGIAYVGYGSANGIRIDNPTVLSPASQFGSSPNDEYAFALAFGDWDADGVEELAVGVPGRVRTAGSADDGLVVIYDATTNGIQTDFASRTLHDQAVLNEVIERGDRLGASLAFGSFNGGSREGLAIGSPGEDYDPAPGMAPSPLADAGSVHIDMPWIQPQNLTCYASFLADCDQNIVFTQKPYEPHAIASTTKIMTCLLAAESTQGGCNPCVDFENDIYTFPQVFDDPANGGTIGGSLAGFCQGELANLELLMYGLMLVSGNDTAFSIADLLYDKNNNCPGTGCQDLTDFVDHMNDRAAQIGMTRSTFNNPSGGLHNSCGTPCWPNPNVSTAEDMAKLAYTAMLNPLVRQIVGTPSVDFIRVSPCVNPGVISTWNSSIFVVPGASNSSFPNGSGMKPGGNGLAGRTFVATVDHPDGRMIAVTLGSTSGNTFCGSWGNVSNRTCDVLQLLDLGAEEFCDFSFGKTPAPAGQKWKFSGVGSDSGSGQNTVAPLGDMDDQQMVVRASLATGNSATASLEFNRDLQIDIAPGASATLSIAPFQRRDRMTLVNVGMTTASLAMVLNQPSLSQTLVLAPGDQHAIGAYDAGSMQPDATLILTNISSTETASLEISERAYGLDVALGPAAPEFTVELHSLPRGYEDQVEITLLGQDSQAGSTMDLLVALTREADQDLDGDFDLVEYAAFQRCFGGRAPSGECLAQFDFDDNGALDYADYDTFEGLLTGPQ